MFYCIKFWQYYHDLLRQVFCTYVYFRLKKRSIHFSTVNLDSIKCCVDLSRPMDTIFLFFGKKSISSKRHSCFLFLLFYFYNCKTRLQISVIIVCVIVILKLRNQTQRQKTTKSGGKDINCFASKVCLDNTENGPVAVSGGACEFSGSLITNL